MAATGCLLPTSFMNWQGESVPFEARAWVPNQNTFINWATQLNRAKHLLLLALLAGSRLHHYLQFVSRLNYRILQISELADAALAGAGEGFFHKC